MYETLNKGPLMTGGPCEAPRTLQSRNAYSVPGFEMGTCLPLVRVWEMRESTAATEREQELISGEPLVQ